MGSSQSLLPEGAPDAKAKASVFHAIEKNEVESDYQVFVLNKKCGSDYQLKQISDEEVENCPDPEPVSLDTALRPGVEGETFGGPPYFEFESITVFFDTVQGKRTKKGRCFVRMGWAPADKEARLEPSKMLYQSGFTEDSVGYIGSWLEIGSELNWPVEDTNFNTPLRFEVWSKKGLLISCDFDWREHYANKVFAKKPENRHSKQEEEWTWKTLQEALWMGKVGYGKQSKFRTTESSPMQADIQVSVKLGGLATAGTNQYREALKPEKQRRHWQKVNDERKAEKDAALSDASEAVTAKLQPALAAVTSLDGAFGSIGVLSLDSLFNASWRARMVDADEALWPGTDTRAGLLLRPHTAEILRIARMCKGKAPHSAAPTHESPFAFVFAMLVGWNKKVALTGLAGFRDALATFYPWAKEHADKDVTVRFFELVASQIDMRGGRCISSEHEKLAAETPGDRTEQTTLPEGCAEWLASFSWGTPTQEKVANEYLDFNQDKTPTERFKRMGRILTGRAARWKSAQTDALQTLIAFGTLQAKDHMDNQEDPWLDPDREKYNRTKAFWEAVADFVLEMSNARKNANHSACHDAIDKCFQDRAAQVFVDGIGVNFRILRLSRDNMKQIHDMYYSKVPQMSGPSLQVPGPWAYDGFKPWVRGGWEYAVR